jgi:hypothetical protein
MSDAEKRVVSGQSWADFCDALKRAGEQVMRPEAPADPFTRAEGFRYLSRLVRAGLEWYVEFNDPDFPVLYKPSHETIKIGADNPDNIYQKAVLDGRHDYRVHGTRGTVDYISMATSKGSYAENFKQIETGFIDSRVLAVAPDGSFDVIVSASEKPGNWLPMDPDSQSLLIRQTFMDRASEVPAEVFIERLDSGATPAPLTAEKLDAGLRTATAFLENTARMFADWSASWLDRPNELPPADQALCHSVGGDPNIFYYHGFFRLDDDEALVIDVDRIPECQTWNLQVDNYWMESLDYRYHRIHVNKHTARYNPDGGVTIVLAHRDPGLANWLDAAGHRLGTLCFRWVGAKETVHPRTRVVKVDSLRREPR